MRVEVDHVVEDVLGDVVKGRDGFKRLLEGGVKIVQVERGRLGLGARARLGPGTGTGTCSCHGEGEAAG